MKMLSPDTSCMSVGVEGARTGVNINYDRQRDGTFHVEDKRHIKALKSVGCTPAVTRMSTRGGYSCNDCGFEAVINHCGRCDGSNLTRHA